MNDNAKAGRPAGQAASAKISFFPAWCKSCGNCVAFCPRQALAMDQWGAPHLARPERCTRCGLCEMLCPDFAISVGDGAVASVKPGPCGPAEKRANQSPERVAPADNAE